MLKKKTLITFLVVALFFISNQALAIVSGQRLWKVNYGGKYIDWQPKSLARDNKDNIYVLGYSEGSMLIIKFDSAGNRRWARKYPGLHLKDNSSVAIDKDGSVYLTGTSYAGRGERVVTLKYDNVGNLNWVRKYGSHKYWWETRAGETVIDDEENIYVSGALRDKYLVVKYDKAGNRKWARTYSYKKKPSKNYYYYYDSYYSANKLMVDMDNNVIFAGSYFNYSDRSLKYSLIKYSPTGTRKWITSIENDTNDDYFPYYLRETGKYLTVDNNNNVIVASSATGKGGTMDYKIVKVNSDGKQKWVRWYNSGDDIVSGIAVDDKRNIYVTGVARYKKDKINEQDFSTVKLDAQGRRRWARKFDGSGRNDDYISRYSRNGYYSSDGYRRIIRENVYGIVVGNNNSVYVLGEINSGKKRLSDFAIVKYDAQGKQRWVRIYNSSKNSYDTPTNVIKDSVGNLYVAGRSSTINYNSYYYDWGSETISVLKYAP